jgi:hypothetical protein
MRVAVMHAGYYADPKQQTSKPWQEAQFDYIDAMLEVAGVRKAEQVRLQLVLRYRAEPGTRSFCGYG